MTGAQHEPADHTTGPDHTQTHGAPIMATHDEAAAKKPQEDKPTG
ncbi:hypothetical protein AC93_3965 [Escherichia coli 2-005-03_S4_C2]|nr:hypothetical protein AD23_4099 [Escherichia coli 2-005-03_S4_C3]EZJ48307.1 hypothetical protein AC93_3965 [Escherichia coli 2-005-03_S4_C2]KDT25231.1 hypothetical protein AC67_4154 [Escherichia coli 2-052-05_S4_C1]